LFASTPLHQRFVSGRSSVMVYVSKLISHWSRERHYPMTLKFIAVTNA